jgi:hypothetical protein
MLKHPQIDFHITMYFVSELQEFEKKIENLIRTLQSLRLIIINHGFLKVQVE